jgi:hypothetical protein
MDMLKVKKTVKLVLSKQCCQQTLHCPCSSFWLLTFVQLIGTLAAFYHQLAVGTTGCALI